MGARSALVVVAVMAGTSHADPAPPAPPLIDDAIRQAAAAKKPLVVEFGASWCGPCKLFEQNVLPDAGVQAALADVVFVRYDAEVAPGDAAAARFHIEAFPTFLVVDRTGVERARQRGSLDGQAFINFVHDAKNHAIDEAEIRADLKTHPRDADAHLRAARWYADHHQTAEAIAHFKVVATDPHAPAVDRDGAAVMAEHLHRVDVWRHDLVADKVARLRAAPASATRDDLAIATVDTDLAPKDIRTIAAAVLAAQPDTDQLNGLVYVALAAGAKDEALVAAKRLVGRRRDAQLLDTFAECLHVTGARAEAMQIEDEAIGLAKSSALEPLLKRNRERFDKGTGDSDEVTQLKARVADLWKRLEAADQLASRVAPPAQQAPSAAAQQQMAQWRKAYDAERALAKAVAATCAKEAGKSPNAVARMEVDATTGSITKIVVLTDDVATTKLRPCIVRELRTATLPAVPGHTNRVLMIDFKNP